MCLAFVAIYSIHTHLFLSDICPPLSLFRIFNPPPTISIFIFILNPLIPFSFLALFRLAMCLSFLVLLLVPPFKK